MTITAQHPAPPLQGDPLMHARARVDAALDQLAATVAQHLPGASDPLGMAGWARRVEARVAAVRLVALGEAEARGAARKVGATGTAAWLSGQGVAPGVARRDVALAGALADPDHEVTRDRLASGGLTPEQAIVITRAKDALSDEVTLELRAKFEADLLDQAPTCTPHQLQTAARRAAARVDPIGSGDLERLERAARARREFTMTRRGDMYVLGGQIDTEGAAYLSAALGPLSAPRPASVDGPDPRTFARRMGDALVDLARRHLNTGDLPETGGLPTQVIVTMTLDQLQTNPQDSGAAELTGGTVRAPLSAGRARRLACDARVLPAVLGGASVVLDLGVNRRTASRAQRLALALRDGAAPPRSATSPRAGPKPITWSPGRSADEPTWTIWCWSATPTTTSCTTTAGPSPCRTAPRSGTHHHNPNHHPPNRNQTNHPGRRPSAFWAVTRGR